MVKWVGLSANYSKDKVNGLYVIRRRITRRRDDSRLIAQSALFCETKHGFFIVEYFTDSIVYVCGPYQYDKEVNKVSAQGHFWECHKNLSILTNSKTLNDIANIMERSMADSPYNLSSGHIGHKAQELTRNALGILNRELTPYDSLNLAYSKALFPT